MQDIFLLPTHQICTAVLYIYELAVLSHQCTLCKRGRTVRSSLEQRDTLLSSLSLEH